MEEKFNSENRLRNETSNVIKNGTRIKEDKIVLYYLPSENPKLSTIVSKKVGNSVTRNKLKRWTRENFRKKKNMIGNNGIAIIYRIGSAEYKFSDVEKILDTLFKKVK